MGHAWKRVALDILKEQDACDHQKKPIKLPNGRIVCSTCLKEMHK